MLVWFMHVVPTSDTIIYHCAAVVDTPLAVDPQIQLELASYLQIVNLHDVITASLHSGLYAILHCSIACQNPNIPTVILQSSSLATSTPRAYKHHFTIS